VFGASQTSDNLEGSRLSVLAFRVSSSGALLEQLGDFP